MANQELASLLKMQDIIEQKLEQLHFEKSRTCTASRSTTQPRCRRSRRTTRGPCTCRPHPLGILFLIVGLFLTREIKATRVGDTDETERPSA